MIEASMLVMTGIRLIPLWLLHAVFLPFLKMCVMTYLPQFARTDLTERDLVAWQIASLSHGTSE